MNAFDKEISKIVDDIYGLGKTDVLYKWADYPKLKPGLVAAINEAVERHVPEKQNTLEEDINTAEENWRLGFNYCRTQILQAITNNKQGEV